MAKGRQVRRGAAPKAANRPEDEVLVDIVEVSRSRTGHVESFS